MEKWRDELYIDALCHHGIKGQKWGVRRYQNEDGTLTEAGKRRTKNGVLTTDQAVAADYQALSKGLSAGKSATDSASNISRKVSERKKSKMRSEIDVSKMSDAELRQKINRMTMEDQYRTMSTKNIRTGSDKVQDVMDVAGNILAIAASAATIAVAIHTIRNK